MQYARIRIDRNPTLTVVTDRNGRFAVPVDPGAHHVQVARLGFNTFSDTIKLSSTNQAVVTITLDPIANDGPCSGFAVVQVKKPWWKIW